MIVRDTLPFVIWTVCNNMYVISRVFYALMEYYYFMSSVGRRLMLLLRMRQNHKLLSYRTITRHSCQTGVKATGVMTTCRLKSQIVLVTSLVTMDTGSLELVCHMEVIIIIKNHSKVIKTYELNTIIMTKKWKVLLAVKVDILTYIVRALLQSYGRVMCDSQVYTLYPDIMILM
jgi:hypothetical protein